ncbi:uncharacterized protein LOC111087341 [Limulus polyphemus]|uniref:Uncharacterized protein LOC111087341 n=1 Tax=Limulus polyphemus TaxID=6850 RepID=A0ABM1T0E6_LIMPO|nr:uncharacterized protein LOC111087341 [Limulus polyphemus]
MYYMYSTFEDVVATHLEPESRTVYCESDPSTSEVEDLSESCQVNFIPHPNNLLRFAQTFSLVDSRSDLRRDQLPSGSSVCNYSPKLAKFRTMNGTRRFPYGQLTCHHRSSSQSEISTNPLLETINALTYDVCDSDDYYDLSSVYQQRRLLGRHAEPPSSKPQTDPSVCDGDKDSIVGYAGSNSIDSGYKSHCPTPEVPENSIYGNETGKSSRNCHLDGTNRSLPNKGNEGTKPKILMGTKVMGKQCSRAKHCHQVSSRRHDSGFYDVNLDHLMYLRQSLLSAIKNCEISASHSSTVESSSDISNSTQQTSTNDIPISRERPAFITNYPEGSRSACCCKNSSQKPCAIPHCSCLFSEKRSKDESLQNIRTRPIRERDSKNSVLESAHDRFCSQGHTYPSHEDLMSINELSCSKYYSCTDTSKPSSSSSVSSSSMSSGSSAYHKTVRFNSDVHVVPLSDKVLDINIPQRRKKHSRSILKDTLCSNLRSKLIQSQDTHVTSPYTLEEEIDALLYGKAEYYDLESIDDFPCSYVAMIEDKYKYGNTTNKTHSKMSKDNKFDTLGNKSLRSSSDSNTESHRDVTVGRCKEKACGSSQKYFSKEEKSTGSSSDVRFTEVAKCMVEVIEDLQKQSIDAQRNIDTSSGSVGAPVTTSLTEKDRGVNKSKLLSSALLSSSGETNSEMYSTASDYHVYEEIMYDCITESPSIEHEVPPPLPARPSSLNVKEPNLALELNNTACKDDPELHGILKNSVNNYPKQRHNLYSIFSDRTDRRTISHSLEHEWKSSHACLKRTEKDEYGFDYSSAV